MKQLVLDIIATIMLIEIINAVIYIGQHHLGASSWQAWATSFCVILFINCLREGIKAEKPTPQNEQQKGNN